MKAKECWLVAGLAVLLAAGGCVSRGDYDRCMNRNQIQMERIASLETAIEAEKLRAEQLAQQLSRLQEKESFWQQQADIFKKTLDAKNAELQRLANLVGQGGPALPVELSNELAEWASQSGSDLVTYDEQTGVVRFTSDLLFDKGEATVQADAAQKVGALAQIMNSPSAEGFDLLIVGHTDDIPIKKPGTMTQHPSNWHLSAHRAISVKDVLARAGLAQTRMAVMGMGEYHPVEPNEAGNKGNPKNRRVEIYIVPSGQIRITTK